ncbi:hypothetical protein THAOC_20578 [Thalassiosira oceanica]|uniref:Uncharacterized protein n=1 Tax=Thalassiosira oceanica TaxID=159749 RepID=K0S213_THAOC|nr:hypothetical protein THAOC_20578 [Thalassiosira oceanica]|eukprot:EJK59230.1 hypothetical protein THAOC_20578 [Thalassiosira oceanica]
MVESGAEIRLRACKHKSLNAGTRGSSGLAPISATRASSHAAPAASSSTLRHPPSGTPAYPGAKFDVGGCCLVHPSVRMCKPTSNGGYKIIRKTCHLCPSQKSTNRKKGAVGSAPSRSQPKRRDLRRTRALSLFASTTALKNGRLPGENGLDVPLGIDIDILSQSDSEREGSKSCLRNKTMNRKKRSVGSASSRSQSKGRDLRQDLMRALSQFTSTAALKNGTLPGENDVDVPLGIEIDISSHCDSEREGVAVQGSTKDELLVVRGGSAQNAEEREVENLQTLTKSAVSKGKRRNGSDACEETPELRFSMVSAKEMKEMVIVDILELSTGICDVLKLSTGAVQDGRNNSDMSEVLTREIFVENDPRVMRTQDTGLTVFTLDSPNEERLNDGGIQVNELEKGYRRRTTDLTETTADITLSEQPEDDDEDGGDKPVRTRSEYIRQQQYESLTRAQSVLKFVRDRIDDVKSMSASEVKVVQCKSSNGEVKTVPIYPKGTEVYYRFSCATGEPDLLEATVVGSHQDHLHEPYYTIKMRDGREKQTDNDHLIFAPRRN